MQTPNTKSFLEGAYFLEDDDNKASFIMRHIFDLKESRDHEAIQDIMKYLDFNKFDSVQVIMTALRICAVRESFNEVHHKIAIDEQTTRPDNWNDFLQRGIMRLKELEVEDIDGMLVGLI